jgi:hypothetical protein
MGRHWPSLQHLGEVNLPAQHEWTVVVKIELFWSGLHSLLLFLYMAIFLDDTKTSIFCRVRHNRVHAVSMHSTRCHVVLGRPRILGRSPWGGVLMHS